MDEKKVANLFKALGDENRIKILLLLKNGEKCACKLLEELNISQPTLSHHMKILCDAEIVCGRKEGKWMHYSIAENVKDTATANLNELLTSLGNCSNDNCCD